MSKHTQEPWIIERDRTGKPKFILAHVDGFANELASLSCDCNGNAEANAQLMVTSPKMLQALEQCQELIKIARQYFPKSVKNSDKFDLENCCATVGKAIHEATGGE